VQHSPVVLRAAQMCCGGIFIMSQLDQKKEPVGGRFVLAINQHVHRLITYIYVQ